MAKIRLAIAGLGNCTVIPFSFEKKKVCRNPKKKLIYLNPKTTDLTERTQFSINSALLRGDLF